MDGPSWTDQTPSGGGLPPMPFESFGWVKVPSLGPTLLVLVLCLLFLALWAARELARVPGAERRHVGFLLACAAAATALRLWAAPQTPEIRWRLEYAWSEFEAIGLADVREYGLGWPLLVRLVGAVVGRSPDLPFTINAVLGGLTVLPIAGFARALGAGEAAARWCAFAMAVMPLAVFFGHTDAPMPGDALFSWIGLFGTARYATRPSAEAMMVAVAGIVCGAQFRLEAAATAPAALTLAMALGRSFPWRRRETWLGAAAVVLLLVPHGFLVGSSLLVEANTRASERTPLLHFGWHHFVVVNPETQAWVWLALTPVGLLFGPVRRSVRAWALAWMMLMGSLVPDLHAGATTVSVNRYQLRSLPFAAFLGGLGAAAVGRVTGWPGAAAMALAAGQGYGIATRETILSREYAFFREALPRVASPCTILSLMTQNDTTLYPPWVVSGMTGLEHRWLDIERDEVPAAGCAVYYRASGCSNHYQGAFDVGAVGPNHPICAGFESRWRMTPLATVELAPDERGPMGRRNQLPGEPIRVGFYRMDGPAPAATPP
jgi:hypothetical protein